MLGSPILKIKGYEQGIMDADKSEGFFKGCGSLSQKLETQTINYIPTQRPMREHLWEKIVKRGN